MINVPGELLNTSSRRSASPLVVLGKYQLLYNIQNKAPNDRLIKKIYNLLL